MTSATAGTCDIPSIDLQPFFEDKGIVIGDAPTEDQRKVAGTIHKACQEHGFVHVTNFGLTKEMGEALFAASKDLFDNPNKLEDYAPWSPIHNTGYSPYRTESLNANRPPELKEAFNLRFPPAYDNPSLPKCPPSLQRIVNEDDLFGLLRTVAFRYGLACAVALDLPPDAFTKTLKECNMYTVRFLHFPPCELGDGDSAGTGTTTTTVDASSNNVPIRVGEHTDFGAYTFLLLPAAQGACGLQVKTVEGGEVGGAAGGEAEGWRDVVVPHVDDPTTFGAIINTGAMMARWTNDHWKATAHRVIVPSAEAAAMDRYSIAFFVDPDSDELIEVDEKYATNHHKTSGVEGTAASVYEPITSREFIQMKLEEMANVAAAS